MRVSAANGATQLCIFEQWIAPGNGAPTHSHPVEEVLTVLAGEAEMWMDDLRAIVSAGQSLIVPARRSHGFRNSGNVTLHIHAVLASAVFEAMPEGATEMVRRWAVIVGPSAGVSKEGCGRRTLGYASSWHPPGSRTRLWCDNHVKVENIESNSAIGV